MSTKPPTPPIAPKRPVEIVHHDHARTDDYAWLKDPDWQAVMRAPDKLDPDIRAYLEAENAYTQAVMADVEGLGNALFAEMKARIKEDDWPVPARDGEWEYYLRYDTGRQIVDEQSGVLLVEESALGGARIEVCFEAIEADAVAATFEQAETAEVVG